MKALIPTVVLCAALAAAGCGSGGSSEATGSTLGGNTRLGGRTQPFIAAPKGPPPKKLVIKDIEEGSGPVAKAGDRATVSWAGFLYKGGRWFFSSWNWKFQDRFSFTIGSGQVIPGWDWGMRGMRVGGRRKMVIPARLAYGARGTSYVPPNEAVIYVVDLLKIKKATAQKTY